MAEIDKVVVPGLPHFGNWPLRTAEALDRYQRAGVDLVSVDEGFDTGDVSGRALPGVVRHLAEGEWWDWRPENLRKEGLAPATVLDVGVAFGTNPLYRAFPDAYHVLIDPLEEVEETLRRLTSTLRGEYLLTAVGAREGVLSLNVQDDIVSSSGLTQVWPPAKAAREPRQRDVPMTTLDNLLEERGWSPPFGLKLDIEGLEYDAIQGAKELLKQTQFVIAEVNVVNRLHPSRSFAEFVSLMDSNGFGLHDVLYVRKKERRVVLIDGLFRRES